MAQPQPQLTIGINSVMHTDTEYKRYGIGTVRYRDGIGIRYHMLIPRYNV
ncbi:hypothetical protein Hanom_Chr17g01571941 [Helianthus anomalus]